MNHKKRDPREREWSTSVLNRDFHQCRRCGRTASHAHHVAQKSTSRRHKLNEDNGVSLCVTCHVWVHGFGQGSEWLVSDWDADKWLADGGQAQLQQGHGNHERFR